MHRNTHTYPQALYFGGTEGNTYEWVMSHMCMSHVTHVHESCHTYKWVIRMCDQWISLKTDSFVWNDSFICVTWKAQHAMFVVSWWFPPPTEYNRVMSHRWTSHDTHMNESCHTYESNMSHIVMSHGMQWIVVFGMAPSSSRIWTSHVTYINESRHTYQRVTSHISMSHVTHINESCRTISGGHGMLW